MGVIKDKDKMLVMRVMRFVLVTGVLVLSTSCLSVYWMEDAQTLGRGRWSVGVRAQGNVVPWVVAGERVFSSEMYIESQLAYGMTDAWDIGIVSSSLAMVGGTWKRRLYHSPGEQTLSVGGRYLLSLYDLLFDRKYTSIWQVDLLYTRSFARMDFTVKPSFVGITAAGRAVFGGLGAVGAQMRLPMRTGMSLQAGFNIGWGDIYKSDPEYDLLFSGGVGFLYCF